MVTPLISIDRTFLWKARTHNFRRVRKIAKSDY